MLVSYKWLQEYFDAPLPPPPEVADLFIFHAFEVESVEEKNGDHIFDLKVLPDRAHDCLSHRGIARELAAMLSVSIIDKRKAEQIVVEEKLAVSVEDGILCRRYVGVKVEGIKVGPSPAWLKDRLEAIGQRSINNIVDATNFVMFDVGQPLHAFDADKLNGGITVRKGAVGETITTLDGKEVTLDENTLVIADGPQAGGSPLAIAGVKGGKKAEVDAGTTMLVLEAANFHPTMVRKASQRLGIRTNSSKRFENELTPELAGEAIDRLAALISEVAGGTVTARTDVYPKRANPYKLGFAPEQINAILGTKLSDAEIGSYLNRLSIPFEHIENPREKIVARAKELIGAAYVPVGTVQFDAPARFSCSSLVNYVYIEAGVALPSISVDQYAYGTSVTLEELLPGDLIFANTGEGAIHMKTVDWMPGKEVHEGVDHVGIFLGDNNVIHATRTKGEVVIETISESASFKNIVGYRRILEIDTPRTIVIVPSERLDLRTPENIAEEVGRLYGYKNLEPKSLGELGFVPTVNKEYYYAEKIRDVLVGIGFSEIKTYTFFDIGEVVLANPFASDKSHLRPSLGRGITQALELNSRNAPLLGLDEVKVFEIGSVFPSLTSEHIALGLGISLPLASKNKDALLRERFIAAKEAIEAGVGIVIDDFIEPHPPPAGGAVAVVIEVDLTRLAKAAAEKTEYGDVLTPPMVAARYKTFSPFPFIARDVAVFVPPDVSEKNIADIIVREAGNLRVQGPTLFDRFEKKNKETGEVEKISYAFRMVFQSMERTLTTEEANEIMEQISTSLSANEGWQVR